MRFMAVTFISILPAVAAPPRSLVDAHVLAAPATDEEIAHLVQDLGNASYRTRTRATRRLCAVGMPAAAALRTAANGDDLETALGAKAVLAVLDRLWFSGVEVRLAFSRSTIAWDEPVDLTVTLSNRSKYPAKVPFETTTGREKPLSRDARQVGRMLDVAEWLRVRGPRGRTVDLTVDDIAEDPDVVTAVQERLGVGPVTILDPGQRVTLTARLFNRGFARFRFLDHGPYSVVMEYVPAWDDDALAAARVGRVVSNEATLTVTAGAPEAVSRTGEEASITIRRRGSAVVARLVNRSDQPVWINKNYGPAVPFAQGRWVWESKEARGEWPVKAGPPASWEDFDANLLIPVEPGGSIELGRIELARLRRAAVNSGEGSAFRPWNLYFVYLNLCSRRWQARQGSPLLDKPAAPAPLRIRFPRRILSGQHSSNILAMGGG